MDGKPVKEARKAGARPPSDQRKIWHSSMLAAKTSQHVEIANHTPGPIADYDRTEPGGRGRSNTKLWSEGSMGVIRARYKQRTIATDAGPACADVPILEMRWDGGRLRFQT